MRKTCRTCGADWVYCRIGFSGEGRSCWIPPETPLLEDELAETLASILKILKQNWFIIGMLPGSLREQWGAAAELVGQGHTALARHQKEMG